MVAVLLTVVPYAAAAVFLAGFAWRVWHWAAIPVPFCIPTTAGQQAGLPFLKPAPLESPSSVAGVAGRVALEVVFFRSLFRDTGHRRNALSSASRDGVLPSLVFPERRALWAAGLLFHWSLLVIVLRHLRFFTEPVPAFVNALAALDAFFRAGTPAWYVTDVLAAAALGWLLVRRLRDPLLRYLSLPADYLALGLLLSVVASGLVLRYLVRPDLVAVKAFALGLVSFQPAAGMRGWREATAAASSDAAAWWVCAHVTLVSTLLAVFPFTKLMHAPAAFLMPTRALRTDSRRRRHVNPWNAEVKVHTYEEWEEEFRDKIRAAGLDGAPQTAAGPASMPAELDGTR